MSKSRHHIALLSVVALGLICAYDVAPAHENIFDGAWQQIGSNAGSCPQCRISVERKGASLRVAANNGWSAVAGIDVTDPSQATGNGIWLRGKPGSSVAGRRFDVMFRLMDHRLHMSMRVDMANGSQRLVTAVYGRVWFGV